MTQKEIIFASQKFYPLSDDQKSKLANYDGLQGQVFNLSNRLNSIKGTWSWHRNNGTGQDTVQVDVSEGGVTVTLHANTGNLGNIKLTKN